MLCKLVFICLTAVIISVYAETKLNSTDRRIDIDKKIQAPVIERHPDERQRLVIFPKKAKTFVITTKSPEPFNWYTAVTRRPLKARLTVQDIRPKTRNERPVATRRPLMKSKAVYQILNKDTDDNIANAMENQSSFKRNNKNNKVDLDQELSFEGSENYEIITEDYNFVAPETEIEVKNDKREKRFIVEIKEFEQSLKHNHDSDLLADEKDDAKEFIFVNVLKGNKNSDTVNAAKKLMKTKSKRSINIIEEENYGTTITGLKFTGGEMRINNDNGFRNINV